MNFERNSHFLLQALRAQFNLSMSEISTQNEDVSGSSDLTTVYVRSRKDRDQNVQDTSRRHDEIALTIMENR